MAPHVCRSRVCMELSLTWTPLIRVCMELSLTWTPPIGASVHERNPTPPNPIPATPTPTPTKYSNASNPKWYKLAEGHGI